MNNKNCFGKYQKDNKQQIKEYQEQWRNKNQEKIKKWFKENKEKLVEYQKKYYEKHKEKILERNKKHRKKRYNSDIEFKIIDILRSRLFAALQGKNKSKSTLKLLGCSVEYLKEHLEKQFKSGMNWDNHGEWEIDHIKPCAKFDLTKESEQNKCFNYKNLQPLWMKENRKKGNNY